MIRRFDKQSVLAAISTAAVLFTNPLSGWAEDIPPMASQCRDAQINDQTISYCSETGEVPLYLEDRSLGGTLFSAAFIGDEPARPVTFVWNGGPGGATWPLREQLAPTTFVAAETDTGFQFVDNDDSLLDATDLVFMDAPGTGYSRVFSDAAKETFWNVSGDADVFADFITDWLERHGREGSPVYLLGESYGGTRAVEVAARLMDEPAGSVQLAGLLLISPSIAGEIEGVEMPPRSAVLLPSEAASAHWHDKGDYTDLSLDALIAQAEAFVADDLAALPEPDAPHYAQIADTMSGFIGIDETVLKAAELDLEATEFRRALLDAEGLVLTTYDGRATYPRPAPGESRSVIQQRDGYDLHEAIVSSLADDLGYATSASYNRDPVEINNFWWANGRSEVNALSTLKRLTADGELRVSVLAGYYDFAVPYLLQKLQIEALDAPEPSVSFEVYPAGHAVFEDHALKSVTLGAARDFLR